MALVYLGLGSNVGDSSAILRAAFAALCAVGASEGVKPILVDARLSRLWRSQAMYFEDQPDFINAAVVGETALSPRELLGAINAIEARFGRDRSRELPKGPRSLDIDILLYDRLVYQEKDLVIPHAALRERRFALVPLLELDGALRDPKDGTPYSEILEVLPEQGIYLLG